MSWPWGFAAALALASLAAARPANVHGGEVVGIILLGDATFTIYDLVALADNDHSSGWLIGQGIWTAPGP